jgi:radical SAM-linked protein
MQRLRIKFSRSAEIKYISHLDMIRLWERALRRAGIPLTYSQGFSPHAQISLALPLSIGMTSEAELMDITCDRTLTPHWFIDILKQQLPKGIEIINISQIAPSVPSLQSQVRYTEYRVELITNKSREEVEHSIVNLLSLTSLPWQHKRDTGVKTYDLRPLITQISLLSWQPERVSLGMRLRCDNLGSGRPEQVTAALGFTEYPEIIHRTALILQT